MKRCKNIKKNTKKTLEAVVPLETTVEAVEPLETTVEAVEPLETKQIKSI